MNDRLTMLPIKYSNVSFTKNPIIFTWDDTLRRQCTTIAPCFLKHGMRCSFYVVPNSRNFRRLVNFYNKLQRAGFEIGNHTLSHKELTTISYEEAKREIVDGKKELESNFKSSSTTFAFPHHSANDELLKLARCYHLETRNTLSNSVRFSLNTDTTISEACAFIEKCIYQKKIALFSGHSVLFSREQRLGLPGEGYRPVSLVLLKSLLAKIEDIYGNTSEVMTFQDAALRTLLLSESTRQGDQLKIGNRLSVKLFNLGLEPENLRAYCDL